MQDPWIRKSLWRRKWQPTPVILPGEFHGQRSLAGYSPWGCKSQAWLSNYHSSLTTSLLSRRVPISFLPACWVSASIPYPCHLGLKMISNYLFENNIFSYLYLVFAFFFWEFLLYVLYFSYWWVPPYLPERPVLYINDNHFSHMLQRFSPKISFIFPFTYVYIESTRVFNI